MGLVESDGHPQPVEYTGGTAAARRFVQSEFGAFSVNACPPNSVRAHTCERWGWTSCALEGAPGSRRVPLLRAACQVLAREACAPPVADVRAGPPPKPPLPDLSIFPSLSFHRHPPPHKGITCP